MKKIYSFLFVSVFALGASSQLVVDNSLSPQQIVEDVFLANGIFVANVTFNGGDASVPSTQVGTFDSANANVGIGSGIIMATGGISVALGPNNISGNTVDTGAGNFGSFDPDLAALVPGYTSNDWAIIEFDFIATGDSLSFTYVFGSEEYLEWVNSSFNDHFAFFMSGPGISGTFSNSAANIALVPGTDLPVAIDNVNSFTNSEYYVDNGDGLTEPMYSDPNYVQFDGLTVPLSASIGSLVIGETYHIKLVIADAGDSILDSGVFLGGDSFVQFCSEEVELLPDACMLSHLEAQVEYTETCGLIQLWNYSEMNIETTGCYYEMGDGGTTSACDQGIMYEYDYPGTYTVKLVYQVNEFEAKFTVAEILISDTPPAQPVITQAGNSVTVTNWDGTSALQWYLNGEEIDGATGSAYELEASGSYTVVANNGCPATSDQLNAVGIGEISSNNSLMIYPNPTDGMFTVKMPTGGNQLNVFNNLGQLVLSQNVSTGNIALTLESGVYSVQVMDAKGNVMMNERVVVR